MLAPMLRQPVPGRAARRSAQRCVLDSCHKFTLHRSNAGSDKNTRWAQTFLFWDCNLLLYQLCHTCFVKKSILGTTFTILYSVLYHTILFYTILYYTILYYTILYYTILYYTILYHTILYHTVLYVYTIRLYHTILCYTKLYYTIL